MSKLRFYNGLLLFSVLAVLSGCATGKGNIADQVKPLVPQEELADTELLDVMVRVFDTEELSSREKEKLGITEEIRQAEQRYVPIHLMHTMQRTGYWGAVRVVPGENNADLEVTGTILSSDGERLSVEVQVTDARGVEWFEKKYSEKIELNEHNRTAVGEIDPFQDLYNTIANDIATYRNKLKAGEIETIRQVSELRFAEKMAPDAFSGYLQENSGQVYTVQRLPVDDDPMLNRVRAVMVRDEMLVDTINGYYDVYYQDLWQPYSDWRRLHGEEVAALREVETQALTRQLMGLASIVGGVLLSGGNGSVSNSNLPGVMVMGGAAAIYSGFQKQEETKIHKDVIEELSLSFAAEAEPLVVEVVGETVRLTGSAEEQYGQWRSLLRDIYAAETGLPMAEGPVGNTTGSQPENETSQGR